MRMTTTNRNPTNLLLKILGLLLGLFILIQLVPYGRAHTNPAPQVEPNWDSPTTATLFNRACADCHSNHTTWPWYSNVAPVSWLVQRHVNEGRSKFNINTPSFGREADEAANAVRKGSMPEPTYLPMHPQARLTNTERDQLIRGLQATFGREGHSESGTGGAENSETGQTDGD